MDKKASKFNYTILNTQLINDGYDFLILGTYFERADFTARIINVKYFILLPSINYVGSDIDNFQWSLMLRSISSTRDLSGLIRSRNYLHKNYRFFNFEYDMPEVLQFFQ